MRESVDGRVTCHMRRPLAGRGNERFLPALLAAVRHAIGEGPQRRAAPYRALGRLRTPRAPSNQSHERVLTR